MAFWGPYWEQCLPFVYKKAILKIVLSPNSHRNGKKLRLSHLTATEKWKPHPLLKNISHLYARKSGFRDHVSNRMYTMFTNKPLTYKDKKWPFYRVIGILFTFCLQPWYAIPHLIATQKAKVWALSKNIPHLYEFLRGGLAPLFTAYFEKYFLSSSKRTKSRQKSTFVKKCSSPISIKSRFWTPIFKKVYRLFTLASGL